LHYEQLCKEFNEEIRYKGPGPWPYNMDSNHYEKLKASNYARSDDIMVRTHEWRYSDSSQYDSVCVICGCTDTSEAAKHSCAIDEPAIRLVRPLQMEYLTVGLILQSWQKYLYQSTEEEFIKRCMQLSNGSMNPVRLRTIYNQLMSEAGI